MPGDPTGDDAGEQGGRRDDRKDEADARALLAASRAHLLFLELARFVDDEDADRAQRDPRIAAVPGLQCLDRLVGRRLVGERRQDQFRFSHVFPCVKRVAGTCP